MDKIQFSQPSNYSDKFVLFWSDRDSFAGFPMDCVWFLGQIWSISDLGAKLIGHSVTQKNFQGKIRSPYYWTGPITAQSWLQESQKTCERG